MARDLEGWAAGGSRAVTFWVGVLEGGDVLSLSVPTIGQGSLAFSVYPASWDGIPVGVATQNLAAVVASASLMGQHQPPCPQCRGG